MAYANSSSSGSTRTETSDFINTCIPSPRRGDGAERIKEREERIRDIDEGINKDRHMDIHHHSSFFAIPLSLSYTLNTV